MTELKPQTLIRRSAHFIGNYVRQWLQPRSTHRDEIFREKVIRSTLALLIPLVFLSFLSTITVFNNLWAVVSFPTLHIAFFGGCIASALAISRRQLLGAGWLLVLTLLVGGSGLILIGRQQGNIVTIVTSGIPSFMLAPLLAAMVLPRSVVIPAGLLAIIMYLNAQFVIPINEKAINSLNFQETATSLFLLIMTESILLRQLRVEFDARFEAMRESIEQTEKARKEADAARQRAEDADNAKSQFLANMSHELRTPLNAIIGYSEAMIGGMAGAFTDKQAVLLGHIQHNGRRLLALINDILDLSKIESGSLEVFLTPMSPGSTIRQTVESLRSLADEKKIGLTVEFNSGAPEIVLSDSKKFEQILVNLLSNALKFTSEGGVTVKVSSVDKDNWRFCVKDTGIGMPPDAPQYIFEPFRQVDGTATRKHKGTGLGLAITKRLIDHLHGTIVVESEIGKGTTFIVTLPVAAVPQPQNIDAIEEKPKM